MRHILRKKHIHDLLEQSRQQKVKKTLGGLDLTLLGIGAVIGTGVMVLTGITAAKDAGPAVIFSFAIAAIVCSLAALCYAEWLPRCQCSAVRTFIHIPQWVNS